MANGDEGPLHIRTMDWEMPALQSMTIEVQFIKHGRPLFVCTTWAGYVGVLTGMRYGGYSVSINYRRSPRVSFSANVRKGLSGGWPLGSSSGWPLGLCSC